MADCSLTQQQWNVTLMRPQMRCHSKQQSDVMGLMLRRCQKSERMQEDSLAAREGIICLSPCHDWSVSEKDQRCDNTGIKWLAFVCSVWLHLSCCIRQRALSQDVVHMHKLRKTFKINLFIKDVFPISTLSLDYKDDNSRKEKINATHWNAKKSVLILQKQSLLLWKLMTYHTMCFIH